MSKRTTLESVQNIMHWGCNFCLFSFVVFQPLPQHSVGPCPDPTGSPDSSTGRSSHLPPSNRRLSPNSFIICSSIQEVPSVRPTTVGKWHPSLGVFTSFPFPTLLTHDTRTLPSVTTLEHQRLNWTIYTFLHIYTHTYLHTYTHLYISIYYFI